ncbi:unnamed protein product [Larinioides sclopetarius]|uniref:Uncharacterized protein n=1 Tax=Larinioides sclopetarius TaxID=280406 RepID=A0AAV2BG90_9ARAC
MAEGSSNDSPASDFDQIDVSADVAFLGSEFLDVTVARFFSLQGAFFECQGAQTGSKDDRAENFQQRANGAAHLLNPT